MARIELRHIGKQFPDGTVALRDIDLTIADGELFVLVGPSGCGKSTLLNIIAGIEHPDGGEILVDDRPVTDEDPKDRNLAMVFQNYALYPHMTVRDNLAFPLRMARAARHEIARRVAQAAAMLELEALLDRRPRELSGGQRQRVAMGRALVREPAAFLLDEPLSNLDARLRVQTRAGIARLRKRLGATMIHVTHDQTEAMTLGDRIAVMDRGVIRQVGSPRELYEAPRDRFVAGFIGEPAMNFITAEYRDGRLVLPMCALSMPEPPLAAPGRPAGKIVAGIRPGDLRLATDTGDASFTASIEVIEWTGADQHVRFRIDGQELLARIDNTTEPAEGDRAGWVMDPQRLHLFDADSGERLTGGRFA